MSKIFFTPGPSQLYPTVKTHVRRALDEDIASISHRSKDFETIYRDAVAGLRELLAIPSDFEIFFAGSATEWMERIIENCVRRHSFHFVNGAFSKRFFEIAQELKKESVRFEVPAGQGFAVADVTIPDSAELICFTQNETSTGMMIPMEDIYSIKKRYPDALVVMDIVSSVPCPEIDFSRIDAAFFSVQKGFGLPAGMGVLILNQKCLKKAEQLQGEGMNVGSYHNFLSILRYHQKHQTPETPNVLGIYLLGRVCADMLKTGIQNIRRQTEEKARLIYDYVALHPELSLFVSDPRVRSQTVIAVNAVRPDILKQKLTDGGYIVGSGYGELRKSQIRIANFPAHGVDEVKKMLELMKI